MPKKESLTCSSCYRPIINEHFTVPAGSKMMAFHKDAHECASSHVVKSASSKSQRLTKGGSMAEASNIEYEG